MLQKYLKPFDIDGDDLNQILNSLTLQVFKKK